MRIAIFDFDGTFYGNETFQLLMERLKNHPTYSPLYKPFFRTILTPYISYKLKLLPEHKMKERSMQIYLNALQHLSRKEIYHYFQEMRPAIQKDFNEKIVQRFVEHRKNGDYTMLVSGAYTPFLQEVTSGFEFDQIIGTDIPFATDESIDKGQAIYHIQGDRKTEKIFANLGEKNVDWSKSYAYGDSFSDLPVLQIVGNPVAVRPDAKLEALAREKKWEIIH
ncbi:HAD family phosphatase [Sporosarcina sp. Te-1]|uniref:HAD family hydrolase n=1 Tax=Sporosarcina sp. Te-1 TaxID=2818390 RepID=UPI001AA001D4|nr:HAD-IB family hydrolase [Sporosarcina sp. Te-1]QTD41292.1 HAD-IB family hydrolase [Sporosarcina sp. Te-1]